MTSPLRIGLTGGLAAGKSTVRRRLAEAGFLTVDADELVAALYEPQAPGADVIAELLGPDHLDARGAVDRPKVARRIFSDAELRQRLEAAIHPLVRAAFAELAAASSAPACVLEATLLVEAGYGPDFDLVVTVEASREAQRRRALERGLSPAQTDARLRAQGDGARRRAGADRTIQNDGTLEDLHRAVDELAAEIRQLATAGGQPAAGA